MLDRAASRRDIGIPERHLDHLFSSRINRSSRAHASNPGRIRECSSEADWDGLPA